MTVENPPKMGFADAEPFYGVLVEGLIEHDGYFQIAARTSIGYWLISDEESFDRWQARERRTDEAFAAASAFIARSVEEEPKPHRALCDRCKVEMRPKGVDSWTCPKCWSGKTALV